MLKNILDIPFLGSMIRSTWTWRLLRLAMLGFLLVMIAYGWHQHAIPGVAVRDPLMYTNFATFNLWVLWMMGNEKCNCDSWPELFLKWLDDSEL